MDDRAPLREAGAHSVAARHLGLGRAQVGFGDLDILAVLLRVEPRQQVTFLDRCSDIDRAGQDLAVDSEADIGLVAGAGSRRSTRPSNDAN